MNNKQKYVLVTSVILIITILVIWSVQGNEFFTKSQVLADNTTELDRMLGIENKQYINRFTFGFIPSGYPLAKEFLSVTTLSGIVIIISGILIFIFRSRRKQNET